MKDYIESIQTLFEENNREIPNDVFCVDIIECIRAIDEWYSYSTPSTRDFENSEITELKLKIKKLESEKDEGWNAFRQNVAKRNNCNTHDVDLKKDGNAFINI